MSASNQSIHMSESDVFVLEFVRVIPHSAEVVIEYILGSVTRINEIKN